MTLSQAIESRLADMRSHVKKSHSKERHRRYVMYLRGRYGLKRAEAEQWAQDIYKEQKELLRRKNPPSKYPSCKVCGKPTKQIRYGIRCHEMCKRFLRLPVSGKLLFPQRNPPLTRIYGKVLRVEAQKTGKHVCDSGCKKAGHRYFHVFKVSPSMYGLPDGSLLIKK